MRRSNKTLGWRALVLRPKTTEELAGLPEKIKRWQLLAPRPQEESDWARRRRFVFLRMAWTQTPQGTRFTGAAAEIPVRTEVVLGFHKISVTESSSEVAELPAELPDLTRTLLAGGGLTTLRVCGWSHLLAWGREPTQILDLLCSSVSVRVKEYLIKILFFSTLC